MYNAEQLEKKWAPILEATDAPAFADEHRKAVTAVLLENQETALRESRQQSSFLAEDTSISSDSIDTWDPVLISLVRRAMPTLIAYDVAGVQPMNYPTQLVFAMKSRYQTGSDATPNAPGTAAPEALFDTIDDTFSGPLTTAAGEGVISQEMGFTIEKLTVEAKTRQLKAEYTMELAQDLKKVHGGDAEAELANILSTEILAEINREVINGINTSAKQGALGTTAPGTFSLDSDADGRWAVEKFKSLLFQIEQEANQIALETRRGKGNFIICTSNVASALAAAGVLDYSPALSTKLNVDITGNTFAGLINGRIKVYVDPFPSTTDEYMTVGYKGSTSYDAGIYYCPYVPLTMMRAVDPDTFQPKIGFKTRYGLVVNPMVDLTGAISSGNNYYFRRTLVTDINAYRGA